MKKIFKVLTIAALFSISACSADGTRNNGSDSAINDSSAMDTAILSTDTSSMVADTPSVSGSQVPADSIINNP